MTPEECRAYADKVTPRMNPDGSVNARHVAIELTLRQQHGHPAWIAELDAPGRYLPPADIGDRDALLDVLSALDRLGLEAINEEPSPGALCYAQSTLLALRDAARRARRHLIRTDPEGA